MDHEGASVSNEVEPQTRGTRVPAAEPRTTRDARRGPSPESRVRLLRSLLALAVLVMGVVDVWSALLSHPSDRLLAIRRFVPTDVLDTSRTFTLMAGALLLVTAWGLRRGKRRAFVAALFLCAVSVPVNLLKALDVEEATVATALMFMLGVSGEAFRVKSREFSLRNLRAGFVFLGLGFVAYAILGCWVVTARLGQGGSLRLALAEAAYQTLGIGGGAIHLRPGLKVSQLRMVNWYLDSLSLVGVTFLVSIAIAALRPVTHRRQRGEDVRRVSELVERYGDSSVTSFALQPDVDYFFSANRRAVIAYRFEADTLLTVGDPIGPPDELPSLLEAFERHCREHDWGFAFFQARPQYLELYARRGWQALHIGEDPVLPVTRFTLEGSAIGQVRRVVRKLEGDGLVARMFVPDSNPFDPLDDPERLGDQMRAISDEWLRHHPGGEKGFCMGRFDLHTLDRSWLAVAWNPEALRVEAFVTWVPIPARRGWTLDLMRRRGDAPTGVMEFLVVKSVETARERGDALVSLSLSALVRVDEPPAPAAETLEASADADGDSSPEPGAPESGTESAAPVHAPHDVRDFPRVREFLMQHLARYYDFQNLFRWKRKFDPLYEDRYLVYPDAMSLPRVAIALVRAQSPAGVLSYLRGS